ncbi:RDD family protein [Corynebacterium sp. YSMAA1_1_D6]|uniref:RDD family protein n=1 Tax=Corynebacterium sp. YSMAA1_1_D6 TaxID=3383589 RepID=UPI0038D124FD
MIVERLGIFFRRVVAWWIDAFLAAAIIVVCKWLVNLATSGALTGHAGEIYDIAALALVFYAYRVWAEAAKQTSLGKWSLKLEVIAQRPGVASALIRNSWILLTLLALTGLPYVEGVILAVLGLSVLAFGQTPFDLVAGCMVERRAPTDLERAVGL